MSFVEQYFAEVQSIADQIDKDKIDAIANELTAQLSMVAVCFSLVLGVALVTLGTQSMISESYVELSPTPQPITSELTARTNDEGWETVFAEWLKVSKLNEKDALFILSVGGNADRNISANLISSIRLARERSASVFGIVGKADGFTYQQADICVHVPLINDKLVTPHSEAFQAVVALPCVSSKPAN